VNIENITIPTWTTPEELKFCAVIAKKARFMVESGCFVGASAKAMLMASPELHLWSVDHFKAFEFNKQIAAIFLEPWISEGRCELIEGDMDKAGEMLVHMTGKIDAAFIDDGHAETDVRRDIKNLLPLLRSGGLLFGHDWHYTNDVAKGVLSMIPRSELYFPCGSIWAYLKP
jgi:predicted O-methyltransferase YrrM